MSSSGNIVGYFGKLPGFNDFVKYNAGSEELLALDKWIQDGIISAKMKLKSDWVNYYKNSGDFFFLYPFTGTTRVLSGLLFFSRDKSGREFPFIVFFYLNKNQLKKVPFYLIPMILFDILNELKSSVADISSINNLSILNEKLNNISYEINGTNNINNVYQSYLNNTSQSVLWDRIIEKSDESARLSFLSNLYQQKEGTDIAAISFLSPKDHFIFDLSFLIHLTFTYGNIPGLFPAFFWNESEKKNHLLYIYINKLLPKNFIDLIKQDKNNSEVIERQSNDSIRNTYENLLNRDITLKELLNTIQ